MTASPPGNWCVHVEPDSEYGRWRWTIHDRNLPDQADSAQSGTAPTVRAALRRGCRALQRRLLADWWQQQGSPTIAVYKETCDEP